MEDDSNLEEDNPTLIMETVEPLFDTGFGGCADENHIFEVQHSMLPISSLTPESLPNVSTRGELSHLRR